MTPEQEAMEILMLFAKGGNAKIMDSGGKDSTVLKAIAMKCKEKYGLQFDIVHNHTSIDAPETVYFIRAERERFLKGGQSYIISYPDIYFDQLCLEKGMLPTRVTRFCCQVLKEKEGDTREKTVTGVRKNESTSRKLNQGAVTILDGNRRKSALPDEVKEKVDNVNFRPTPKGGVVLLNYDNDENVQMVYTCFRTNRVLINPLINWTDDDIWRYINDNDLPLNPLYKCGWNRVGCVGCPMAGYKGRIKEFERYPKFRERYIRIADKLVEKKKAKKGKDYNGVENGLQYFKIWIEDPVLSGQFEFDIEGNITQHD